MERWGATAFEFVTVPTDRRSRVLHPFAVPCMHGVLALNVSRGCAHACAYCYMRAYPETPPRGWLHVYDNLAARLEEELARMRRPPRAVSLCTATDPFQPSSALLSSTYQAAELLLKKGVTITFLTKGFIADEFISLFSRFPHLVRARIGFLSLDPLYHQLFEPGTAPPTARLANIQRLREAGVPVGVRHDPVIPGVTDRPEGLEALFGVLAQEQVTQVDVGHLYLRPGIMRLLEGELPREVARPLLRQFRGGPVARVAASAATQLLPPELRARSFSTIRRVAREQGITPILCRCKNPDLAAERCQGARELAFPRLRRQPTQLSLTLGPGPGVNPRTER
ncbi:MAG: radical SAM protein [Candidatus Methylomirabilia bacterium]